MQDWSYIYIIAFVMPLVLACITTPLFRAIAWKTNILDKPLSEGHKMHSNATPLLGGAAVCSAWLVSIFFAVFALKNIDFPKPNNFPDIFAAASPVLPVGGTILFCATSFVIMGLLDDKHPMSAKFKLFLQALLCFGTATAGVRVDFIANAPLAIFITGMIYLTILNAVNFLDNMDGLCCGVGAICAGTFAIAAILQDQYLVAMLGAVTSGACFGFYIFNCNPASIFLGDSGSHFVGYMLGVLGVLVTYTGPNVAHNNLNFIIPLLILAIPLFDLASVVIIRLRHGQPIYIGDHNHISHRFVKMGFSRRSSVFLVHCLCFVIGLSGIALLRANYEALIVILLQVIALLVFMTILHSRQKQS